MRLFVLLAALVTFFTVSQAWDLQFRAMKGNRIKHISAHGTKFEKCVNLRSTYDWPTTSIWFDPDTRFATDPTGYTAYSKANCKGTAYYGADGTQHPIPKRRFRSYKVTG